MLILSLTIPNMEFMSSKVLLSGIVGRNGVYDPLDLNGNNQWDRNEDRPDIIGGFTAWCVYNDGVATEDRAFEGEPMGIEIQQTVFAFYSYYADNKVDPRASTFFVRY